MHSIVLKKYKIESWKNLSHVGKVAQVAAGIEK